VPERNHAIEQSVTVHEKSRKTEPFNVLRTRFLNVRILGQFRESTG